MAVEFNAPATVLIRADNMAAATNPCIPTGSSRDIINGSVCAESFSGSNVPLLTNTWQNIPGSTNKNNALILMNPANKAPTCAWFSSLAPRTRCTIV